MGESRDSRGSEGAAGARLPERHAGPCGLVAGAGGEPPGCPLRWCLVSPLPSHPPPRSPPGPVRPQELLGGGRPSPAGSGRGVPLSRPWGSAEMSRTLLSPHLFVSPSELDRLGWGPLTSLAAPRGSPEDFLRGPGLLVGRGGSRGPTLGCLVGRLLHMHVPH